MAYRRSAIDIIAENMGGNYEEKPTPGLMDDECCNEKFDPQDYSLARQLIEQVGGADRARELIDNLEAAMDDLGMDCAIDQMADEMPESPDLPNSGAMGVSIDLLGFDSGVSGLM